MRGPPGGAGGALQMRPIAQDDLTVPNLHRELLQEQMVDIALMPLHWAAIPILILRGVSGPQTIYNRATFHIWQWDKI